MDPWQTLTTDYEQRRAREDSLDQLMEWDAQRSLIGSVEGKTVLDIGCGNGEKAIELAHDHGATTAVGVDVDVVLFLQSLGDACHTVGPYSYPSRWNEDVTITNTTDTFSSIHNSLTDSVARPV